MPKLKDIVNPFLAELEQLLETWIEEMGFEASKDDFGFAYYIYGSNKLQVDIIWQKGFKHAREVREMLLGDVEFTKREIEEVAYMSLENIKNVSVLGITTVKGTITRIELLIDIIEAKGRLTFADIIEINSEVCTQSPGDRLALKAGYLGISTRGGADAVKKRLNAYIEAKTTKFVFDTVQMIEEVREALGLNDGEWACMPDDFLLVAFTKNNSALKIQVRRFLMDTHRMAPNYETLEFLGDSVLEVVIRNWIFLRHPEMGPGQMSRLSSKLVRNISLRCFMGKKNLCSQIIGASRAAKRNTVDRKKETGKEKLNPDEKVCADVFEAVVGALFHYSNNIEGHGDSLDKVTNWITTVWNIDELLDVAINSPNTCPVFLRNSSV